MICSHDSVRVKPKCNNIPSSHYYGHVTSQVVCIIPSQQMTNPIICSAFSTK